MKRGNLVLMFTMMFILSLVVYARLPQQNPSQQPSAQGDQDRIEAAHGKLLSGEDKAKEASRLTEAISPALPQTAASTAPVPRKNFVDELLITGNRCVWNLIALDLSKDEFIDKILARHRSR